jgi:hypothetical protein
MRHSVRLALFVLALPSACGGSDYDAHVKQTTVTKVVPHDTRFRLGYFDSVTQDCTPTGPIELRVISAPGHGRYDIQDALNFPEFPASNTHSVCNTHKVPSREIWYTPAPGYVGDDSLKLDVVFSVSGWEVKYEYLISVR